MPILRFPDAIRFRRAWSATALATQVLSTILILGHSGPAHAAAQLVVAPTRVVFEGRTRTASVNLINRGDKVGTFRIKFERKRMTEDGSVVPLEKAGPGQMFADQMVRYAPRQITLEPGQSQVVRLMLRKPPNLPDGEYRSHMLFQTIPGSSGSDISRQAGDTRGLSIRLIPIIGISIPVIVRQGQTSASVSLTDVRLEQPSADGMRAILVLTARRSGNESVYGDFSVRLAPSKGGRPLVVGRGYGVAVYTPNDHRVVKIPLQTPHGVRLRDGTLEVTYRVPPEAGDKVLATVSTRIGAAGR